MVHLTRGRVFVRYRVQGGLEQECFADDRESSHPLAYLMGALDVRLRGAAVAAEEGGGGEGEIEERPAPGLGFRRRSGERRRTLKPRLCLLGLAACEKLVGDTQYAAESVAGMDELELG
jgi:hypothetical protein